MGISLLVQAAKLQVFSVIVFQETYVNMTLHAMLMIHMQKLVPGYYGGKKRITILNIP